MCDLCGAVGLRGAGEQSGETFLTTCTNVNDRTLWADRGEHKCTAALLPSTSSLTQRFHIYFET